MPQERTVQTAFLIANGITKPICGATKMAWWALAAKPSDPVTHTVERESRLLEVGH